MTRADVPESIAVALRVVRLLERLGVRCAIGGSIASTIHGEIRSTNDADIVAELQLKHLESFIKGLGDDFYSSEDRIREAIVSGGSFNLIALRPMFKVNVFIANGQPFETSQLDRRTEVLIWENPPERVFVSSAEDTILAKLSWYRKGGEISDRQWRDVLGVIRTRGVQLDADYMRRMASISGVADLLAQALYDADPKNREL